MKTKYIFFVLCLLLFADFVPLAAQRSTEMPQSRRKSLFGRELFAFRYYSFADTTDRELTRVNFHFAVINDLLSFLRTDDGKFRARYEIIVLIYDKDKNAIAEKSLTHRVLENDYKSTNNRTIPHLHELALTLPSGFYEARIQLYDLESDQEITREEDLHVRDMSPGKLRISDPVFADGLKSEGKKIIYAPNLLNVFQDINSSFSSYVEFYPPAEAESLQVDYKLHNKDNQTIHELTRQFAGQNVVVDTLSLKAILKKPGEYTLNIQAQAGGQVEKISRSFQVFWGNMPLKTENLAFAVEQLALVANKSTIDSLREVNGEARQELFNRFWDKRDPTPKTQRNELKEEFFRRVDFANQNFTEIASGRSGWQTDRGRVFIKYGPPDAVDRRPVEVNMPASEIWTYNKENRRYFFIDRNNDGIYRLVKVE